VKFTAFEVPPSVVTVTGAVVAAPVGVGTWSRQLVEVGQAMSAFSPPNWAVIWPEGLTRLLPVTTRTCPAAPLEGSIDESSGPPEADGGTAVGDTVAGGTVVAGTVAGGTVVAGTVVGGAVVAGTVETELSAGTVGEWEPAEGLLRGAGTLAEEATGVPWCRVVTTTPTAATATATPSARMRRARGWRRVRWEDDG
jgi:hypothetical protein